jgi:hypothetical protein
MRVHARGRVQPARPGARELDRAPRAVERAAGDDQPRDAGGEGPRDDRAPVGVVAVVREVDADVDDPLISNSSEFSVDNPEFQTQDASQIRVRQ